MWPSEIDEEISQWVCGQVASGAQFLQALNALREGGLQAELTEVTECLGVGRDSKVAVAFGLRGGQEYLALDGLSQAPDDYLDLEMETKKKATLASLRQRVVQPNDKVSLEALTTAMTAVVTEVDVAEYRVKESIAAAAGGIRGLPKTNCPLSQQLHLLYTNWVQAEAEAEAEDGAVVSCNVEGLLSREHWCCEVAKLLHQGQGHWQPQVPMYVLKAVVSRAGVEPEGNRTKISEDAFIEFACRRCFKTSTVEGVMRCLRGAAGVIVEDGGTDSASARVRRQQQIEDENTIRQLMIRAGKMSSDPEQEEAIAAVVAYFTKGSGSISGIGGKRCISIGGRLRGMTPSRSLNIFVMGPFGMLRLSMSPSSSLAKLRSSVAKRLFWRQSHSGVKVTDRDKFTLAQRYGTIPLAFHDEEDKGKPIADYLQQGEVLYVLNGLQSSKASLPPFRYLLQPVRTERGPKAEDAGAAAVPKTARRPSVVRPNVQLRRSSAPSAPALRNKELAPTSGWL